MSDLKRALQFLKSILRRPIKGLFLFLLFLTLLISACGGGSEATKAGTIIGVIYDSKNNEVLADVKVSIAERFVTSSTRGVFELSQLPLGTARLTFQKDGYKPTMREVEVGEEKIFMEVLMESQQAVAYTIADQVKLRGTPSLDGEILEAMALGTKVALTGEAEKGWYKGQVGDKVGWIWGGYLKSSDLVISRMEILVDCKLYKEPQSAEEIGEAYAGLQVVTGETSGSWIKVTLPSGVEGWVETKNLSP